MFKYLPNIALLIVVTLLSACSSVSSYLGAWQAQPTESLAQRSQNYQPVYRLKEPEREALGVEVLRRIGAPPPQSGKIFLDKKRYYSANGYICQRFQETIKQGVKKQSAACYVNGQWVKAASVLSSELP